MMLIGYIDSALIDSFLITLYAVWWPLFTPNGYGLEGIVDPFPSIQPTPIPYLTDDQKVVLRLD